MKIARFLSVCVFGMVSFAYAQNAPLLWETPLEYKSLFDSTSPYFDPRMLYVAPALVRTPIGVEEIQAEHARAYAHLSLDEFARRSAEAALQDAAVNQHRSLVQWCRALKSPLAELCPERADSGRNATLPIPTLDSLGQSAIDGVYVLHQYATAPQTAAFYQGAVGLLLVHDQQYIRFYLPSAEYLFKSKTQSVSYLSFGNSGRLVRDAERTKKGVLTLAQKNYFILDRIDGSSYLRNRLTPRSAGTSRLTGLKWVLVVGEMPDSWEDRIQYKTDQELGGLLEIQSVDASGQVTNQFHETWRKTTIQDLKGPLKLLVQH